MSDEPLLLDTCVLLDWTLAARQVSKRAAAEIDAATLEGRAYLSAISLQEVFRLAERGRLDLRPTPLSWLRAALRAMQLTELPFTWDAAMEAGCLVDVNADPVDRALLGSAIAGGLALVTRDEDLLAAAKRKGVRAIDTRA